MEDEKIAYVILFLEGPAYEWLEYYIFNDLIMGQRVVWLHNISLFWTEFKSRWGINKNEEFHIKLRKLMQEGSVQAYYTTFMMYAQPLGYDDVCLKDLFYYGLSGDIKKALMAQNYDHTAASTSLEALAQRALKIDQRLEEFQLQGQGQASLGSQ